MKFLEAKQSREPDGENKMVSGPSGNKSKRHQRATTPLTGDAAISRLPRSDAGPPNRDESEDLFASADAEAMAKEHGVDPSSLKGTGRDGKITKSDVRDAIVAARTSQDQG